MKSIGLWARSHADASSKPGQLPALDALEERGPAVDLAFVEAVGPTEVLQALGLPVDVAEQRDALDELVGEPLAGLEVGVERRRPAVGVHRRPAVDPAHQVEGAAEHRRVLAHPDGLGVGHLGAVERLDDPPLADDALVAVGRRGGRWDPDHAVDAVAASARRSRSASRPTRNGCSSGSPLPGSPWSSIHVASRSKSITGSPPRVPGTRRTSPWPLRASSGCARSATDRRSACSRGATAGRW